MRQQLKNDSSDIENRKKIGTETIEEVVMSTSSYFFRFMILLFICLSQISCSLFSQAIELRAEKVETTKEPQDVVEGWELSSTKKPTPKIINVSPKQDYVFVLIDISITNRTEKTFTFEGDKLKATIKGKSLEFMRQKKLEDGRDVYIGEPFHYSFEIQAKGNKILKLLTTIEEGKKIPINIKYEGSKSIEIPI